MVRCGLNKGLGPEELLGNIVFGILAFLLVFFIFIGGILPENSFGGEKKNLFFHFISIPHLFDAYPGQLAVREPGSTLEHLRQDLIVAVHA